MNNCFALDVKDDPVRFFKQQAEKKEEKFYFNKYETLLSGTLAFAIGNIGYYTTNSYILKLGYSGVQTIGVINFGRGLYNLNSPNIENELSKLLSNKEKATIDKNFLSLKLIEINAREERAKRVSLFYSSSLLSFQYLLNAFVGDTPKELRNIYVFMAGINSLIAGYSSLSKSEYEKYYFGDNLDISPTVSLLPDERNQSVQKVPSLFVTYRF